MHEKKISVIMPVYNRGNTIQRAIYSVIGQTYTNWELIIIDDGSRDDTAQKVREIVDDRICLICCENNLGASHARNTGLRNANGTYIAFLDSDNEWYHDYLKKQIMCLEDPSEKVDVVFGKMQVIRKNSCCIFPKESEAELDTEEKMIKLAVIGNLFDTNVVCMHRKVWEESGGFDENLYRFQDWDYFLGLLIERRYRFKFNNEILNVNYIQEDSISNNDNLYWDARLQIFAKYIEACRGMNLVLPILFCILHNNQAEYILPYQAERLFSILNAEEKMELCKKHYENYMGMVTYFDCSLNNSRSSTNHFKLAMKNDQIINVLEKWVRAVNRGKKIEDYFLIDNIKSVCIYGFGVLGRLLCEELENSSIEVRCIIDGNIKSKEVPISKLEEVDKFDFDEIVVTALNAFEEIKMNLQKKTIVKVVSFEDIIDAL